MLEGWSSDNKIARLAVRQGLENGSETVMMCGLEAVALTKRKEANLKMARFSLRMIRCKCTGMSTSQG